MHTVEDLVIRHPIEAPRRRIYRQIRGETPLGAGPVTDVQHAMPAMPPTDPRPSPFDEIFPRYNIALPNELAVALEACFSCHRTEAQVHNDINTVRNCVLFRDRLDQDPNVGVSCTGDLLRVILARLLRHRAVLRGAPVVSYQEMSRLVRSGLSM